MTKPGRIPCLNPRCNRTGSPEKLPNCTSIVCYQCWKKTPKAFTERYKSLKKRERSLQRMLKKRPETHENPHIFDRIWWQMDVNWARIRAYWTAPEPESPPEGLESFLEEVGLV